jgi:hypothetical protein
MPEARCVLCDRSDVSLIPAKATFCCIGCIDELAEYLKKIRQKADPQTQYRYFWIAEYDDGTIIEQFEGGKEQSVARLDFQRVKRLRLLPQREGLPEFDLRVNTEINERGIKFWQKSASPGMGMVDIREVLGIQKTVGGRNVKFFVLACADGRIIISSNDNV